MRTQLQVQADEVLTDAINATHEAYWPTEAPEPRILTGYIVISHRTYWDEDGDQRHEYGYLPSDGHLAHHEMLGLVEYVQVRLRRLFEDSEEMDD